MDSKEMFSRSEMLLGEAGIEKLQKASVAVFGLGGVGGYTCEALARAGVGTLHLVDGDTVRLSNVNRQIIAFPKDVGKYKADLLKTRLCAINPDANIKAYKVFFEEKTSGIFDFESCDYIVDAIDTITSKILLVIKANESHTPIISCMGAGNKLDPTAFEVADIYETNVCPLARIMRKELRKKGISRLKTVYSKETPVKPGGQGGNIPGSVSFVPPVAGMVLAGEVVKGLL